MESDLGCVIGLRLCDLGYAIWAMGIWVVCSVIYIKSGEIHNSYYISHMVSLILVTWLILCLWFHVFRFSWRFQRFSKMSGLSGNVKIL